MPSANGRTLTDAVEAFASPVILLDMPSTAVWATEAGIASFAGQDASLTSQGDAHQTAAHTWASVSGKTTSWYVHQGGIKAFAANGPVSLRAHTDAFQILADKDVTVTSVNDEIRISAQTRIELVAGQSAITLDGADIELKTPGAFSVKGSGHTFLGGAAGQADIEALPQGLAGLVPLMLELHHHWPDLTPAAGGAYRAAFADGTVRTGRLDDDGHARLEGIPAGPVDVFYGEDARPPALEAPQARKLTDEGLAAELRRLGFDPDEVDVQELLEHGAGRIV